MELNEMVQKYKLTKSYVESLPLTETGQAFYWDRDLPGFGVRVGQSTKTYFVQRDVQHRSVRTTIGRHGLATAEQARRSAHELLVRMANGENPNREHQQLEVHSLTLAAALETHLGDRKELRPFTIQTYRRAVGQHLGDWMSKPLMEISRDMVIKRHKEIGEAHGHPTANNAMRILRAVYNHNRGVYDGLPENPVRRLTDTRAWYKEHRRRSIIKTHQLPAWYTAVQDLENADMRDFLMLVLFTGMRRSEAAGLRWENIDLEDRTLTVPMTKNGDPLVLPLSSYLYDLLARRFKETISEWVFAGRNGNSHLVEPKKAVAKVVMNSGVKFTLHDLRRTYITIAESLDIPAYALKALLNHKMNSDVTAGYIVVNIKRLRQPVEKISKFLISQVNRDG